MRQFFWLTFIRRITLGCQCNRYEKSPGSLLANEKANSLHNLGKITNYYPSIGRGKRKEKILIRLNLLIQPIFLIVNNNKFPEYDFKKTQRFDSSLLVELAFLLASLCIALTSTIVPKNYILLIAILFTVLFITVVISIVSRH